MKDFSEFFEETLSSALNSSNEDMELVQEQFDVLVDVFKTIHKLFGVAPEMKLRPTFASGSVTVSASEFSLTGNELLQLAEVLGKCNTLEVLPLVNGNVEVSVTVPGVYEMID